MKYIKSIKEHFDRVVGFRYSEPKECYKISMLCVGEEITEDKIRRALNNVTELKYNQDSIVVTDVSDEFSVNQDENVKIDAIVEFEIFLYTDREANGVVDQLGKILLSAFEIEVVQFKFRMKLDI